jgi:hypothetical protein
LVQLSPAGVEAPNYGLNVGLLSGVIFLLGGAMEGVVAFGPETKEALPELLDYFGAPGVAGEFVGVEFFVCDMLALDAYPFQQEASKKQVLPANPALTTACLLASRTALGKSQSWPAVRQGKA